MDVAGYCAASLPVGFYQGMPVRLQIIGRPDDEALVLRGECPQAGADPTSRSGAFRPSLAHRINDAQMSTMPDLPPSGARASPATARNRGPILDVLKSRLPTRGLVLEIAAGAGEHALYNAAALPGLQWQPTDVDPEALESISAWRAYAGLPNLLPARRLDAADPESWPVERADAVISINMVHISPWAATEGLMTGAGRVLAPGGGLFLYGPFFESGVASAPSNLEFDQGLRRRNSEWGIRQLETMSATAGAQGLVLSERISMPANNLTLVFRKV